ncbi:MAG: prepilin-type N-terminal cleavage/methylation domain-containing protein [Phycisphaerae bacterium]|nr:prepilin-type N-terminal cleavage/methylation domain-containing protein [Phycisphaerae bacterium]
MEGRRSEKNSLRFSPAAGCGKGGFTLTGPPVEKPFDRLISGRCKSRAFTLVELLIVIAILILLLAMLVPSLSAARRQASMLACTMQIRGVGVALKQFAIGNKNCLPPFAFSDYDGNLPLSGHWGGWSQVNDPDCFGRDLEGGMENVNLYRLVSDGYISAGHLICPGAEASLTDGSSSYFPYTPKFSTYCLRMPYSKDVFRAAPSLIGWAGRGLLGIYTQAAGGEEFQFGSGKPTVPLVRTDLTYREVNPADNEQRTMSFADGAIMSDAFWYRDRNRPAEEMPGLVTYKVRAGWCHGSRFNVLFGDGAVHVIDDDGTVEANSVGPDSTPPDDGANFASYAITVWRYFKDNR